MRSSACARGPDSGTRFRLFPQPPFLNPGQEPETVWLSPPAGSIGPGPQDERMYVVDPIGKVTPYGIARTIYRRPFLYLPPWNGPIHPPARPDPTGHFDHLEVGAPEFELAHLYGTVRFVLDVWEGYFGRPIPWHFRRDHARLELGLLPELDNALVGYGFMEVGAHVTAAGEARPYSLNFDVLAHEVGHLLAYAELGVPVPATEQGEYFGFQEAAADLVALISVLHFESVVDHLLETTRGNLYTLNHLNRIAELSDNDEIRLASNDLSLADFATGWTDEHLLSEPLTGAMFDILVDIFHENLLERGLISPQLEHLADVVEGHPEYLGLIQARFDEVYERRPEGFKEALLEARDRMGVYLAASWPRLSPHDLDYAAVGDVLLETDRELGGGRYQRLIFNNFVRRDIGAVRVGPRLEPPGPKSHTLSVRTVVPEFGPQLARLSYRERWQLSP